MNTKNLKDLIFFFPKCDEQGDFGILSIFKAREYSKIAYLELNMSRVDFSNNIYTNIQEVLKSLKSLISLRILGKPDEQNSHEFSALKRFFEKVWIKKYTLLAD